MEELNSTKIELFKDAIYSFDYDIRNSGLDIKSVPFNTLLRPFRFWEENFEDIYEVTTVCMPVFIAYYIATSDSEEDEFTRESVQRVMELASSILDGSDFSISETDDPDGLLIPNYDLKDKVSKMDNLLSIHPMIESKETELKAIDNETIQHLMQLSAVKRLERYEDVIRSINTSKNCVYNIVRKFGDKLLEEIETEIESLIPSAQDFVLHGLDAFPKNEKIMIFLKQFILKHEGEWVAKKATIYLNRIESGKETTGWEID